VERLAHTHEHERELAGVARAVSVECAQNLTDDLARGEVTLETECRRRAEGAAERTANLARDSERHSLGAGSARHVHDLGRTSARHRQEQLPRAIGRNLRSLDAREHEPVLREVREKPCRKQRTARLPAPRPLQRREDTRAIDTAQDAPEGFRPERPDVTAGARARKRHRSSVPEVAGPANDNTHAMPAHRRGRH